MNTSPDFIITYFTEEKIESLFFIILGFLAVSFALFFLSIIKYSFFKGMAIPFILIGCIQLTVGTTIYLRTQNDIVRVSEIVKSNNAQLKTTEILRIENFIQNFSMYKWIEIGLIIFGITLIIIYYKSPQTFWKGIGLGILIQASLMLGLDVIAEQRAEVYLQLLLEL